MSETFSLGIQGDVTLNITWVSEEAGGMKMEGADKTYIWKSPGEAKIQCKSYSISFAEDENEIAEDENGRPPYDHKELTLSDVAFSFTRTASGQSLDGPPDLGRVSAEKLTISGRKYTGSPIWRVDLKDAALDIGVVELKEETVTEKTVSNTDASSSDTLTNPFPLTLSAFLLGALIVAVLALVCFRVWGRRLKRSGSQKPVVRPYEHTSVMTAPPSQSSPMERQTAMAVGSLHNIGKRASQQDSYDAVALHDGIVGVVADGMGGLSDGDKVSQKIVRTIRADASGASVSQISENLLQLVAHANTEVNQMLGYSPTYRSGSTLILVAAEARQFRWASVGDSRIYLFRGGALIQMNREHVYEAELLRQAVNREVSFAEAKNHPKRRSVTSFIGMGSLRGVDTCLTPVRTIPGDKVLLCSDGVFNALPEQEIARILSANPDPAAAAAALETEISSRNIPQQDNFTAVLIAYR